jgi:hypothetical protein
VAAINSGRVTMMIESSRANFRTCYAIRRIYDNVTHIVERISKAASLKFTISSSSSCRIPKELHVGDLRSCSMSNSARNVRRNLESC